MSQTRRSSIGMLYPTIPDDDHVRRMRDAVLSALLDTPHGADILGELVRGAWVSWASEQPDPKPHWLTPWAELGEADKEADRRIGMAIARYIVESMIRVSYPMPKAENVRQEE